MKPKGLKTKNNTGGVVGCTGKWWTLEKKSGVRGTKWGKVFQTKKGSFQTKTSPLSYVSCSVKAEG